MYAYFIIEIDYTQYNRVLFENVQFRWRVLVYICCPFNSQSHAHSRYMLMFSMQSIYSTMLSTLWCCGFSCFSNKNSVWRKQERHRKFNLNSDTHARTHELSLTQYTQIVLWRKWLCKCWRNYYTKIPSTSWIFCVSNSIQWDMKPHWHLFGCVCRIQTVVLFTLCTTFRNVPDLSLSQSTHIDKHVFKQNSNLIRSMHVTSPLRPSLSRSISDSFFPKMVKCRHEFYR